MKFNRHKNDLIKLLIKKIQANLKIRSLNPDIINKI